MPESKEMLKKAMGVGGGACHKVARASLKGLTVVKLGQSENQSKYDNEL